MKTIQLTERGLRTANRILAKQEQSPDALPYSATMYGVSPDEWTVGNDLLLLLGGFSNREEIQARSLAYEDAFTAVRVALEPQGWTTPVLRKAFDHLVVSGFLRVEGGPQVDTMITSLRDICSALSNDFRIQLLLLWRDAPYVGRAVEDVLERLQLPESRLESTRRHLGILEDVGLLSSRTHGRRKEYRMDVSTAAAAIDLIRCMFPISME